MIVWEYICDENNNIITVQQWNQLEKPEFQNNPQPNDDILKGKLIDKWGNYLFKLEDCEIIENKIEIDDKQDKIEKLSKKNLLDIIRILIQGITNSSDSEYLDLKSEILG